MTDPKTDYRPSIHRFTLGDAAVSTILDGAHLREPIKPPFALDKSDDEIAEIARAKIVIENKRPRCLSG